MSAQKPSLSQRFRHWAGNSAVIGIPAAIAYVGYTILRTPDRMARGYLALKFTPLEKFEPAHHGWRLESDGPPYWQDLVFGDGRAEKLVKRLEGIPQVKLDVQKFCLARSSGGLQILPAHRDIIKHGLTDKLIAYFMYQVDRTTNHLARHADHFNMDNQPITFDKNASLIMNKDGIYSENRVPIIQQGNPDQYFQMGLTDLIDVYRANGCKDPEAIGISNRISQAVYTWFLEDVLPAVPNLFPSAYHEGYKATAQSDGSFRLERLPKDADRTEYIPPKNENEWDKIPIDLIHKPRKTLYTILADEYKGSLPAAPVATPQPPQP